jgi:hypothetical protein
MRTIRLERTIRRQLGSLIITFGPDGVSYREKRQKRAYLLTHREAYERAQGLLAAGVVAARAPREPERQADLFAVPV